MSHNVPSHLPAELSLCLFRVVQEALQNAVKHSGAHHFDVELWSGAEEVRLSVSDSGKGFDTEAAMRGTGLGLTSMRERVRLLNGSIEIQSKPMCGTTIHVRVPFGSRDIVQPRAGLANKTIEAISEDVPEAANS